MDDDEPPLILLLYNLETNPNGYDARDLIAIQDTAKVAELILYKLKTRGWPVVSIPVESSLEALKSSLKAYQLDSAFVFNLCDGFNGSNKDAILILKLIEQLGFSHTGSSAKTTAVCINKQLTKTILKNYNIPTPSYQIFAKPGLPYKHGFPAIVKPSCDDGSMGIDSQSVVNSNNDLMERVEMILNRYHQPVLVEKYIAGREFSVSLWGNQEIEVLPITEMDYSDIADPLKHILSYESKWEPDSYFYQNIHAHCPARLTAIEEKRIKETAIRAYQVLKLRDFGRMDIRYFDGIPYIIDVNEIPDLGPDSGFPNAANHGGYDYISMLEHILNLAIKREKWPISQMTSYSQFLQRITNRLFLK